MNLPNKWAAELLGKDKVKAQGAAEHIINTQDLDAWKCLIENSDYLFGYIKDRAGKNLSRALNPDNINNIFSFLKYHSPDWDYNIAMALSNFSNDEFNLKMLELLKTGSSEEKAYAAKYFSFVNYNEAKDVLLSAAKEDYQPLKNNAAEALGKLNDIGSYNYFIEKLKSDDDWDRLEAAQFLACYGNKDAIADILNAMSDSGMSEHMAGEAATLVDLYELFDDENEIVQVLALEALDNIISGLAEIWTLSVILDFKLYENLEKLIELAVDIPDSNISGKYAQVLLKAKSKVTLLIENSQYTYDEEKAVLEELDEIYHLLFSQDQEFWVKQVDNLIKELNTDNQNRKLAAISVINDFEIEEAVPCLIDIISNQNESEIILCEAVSALVKLGATSQILDKESILSRINDVNLIAIVRSAFNNQ